MIGDVLWKRRIPHIFLSEREFKEGECRKQLNFHKVGDVVRPVNKTTLESYGIGTCITITSIKSSKGAYIVKFSRSVVKTLV